MTSARYCRECREFTAQYLDQVSYHASLIGQEADPAQDSADMEYKLAQAERRIREGRERFEAHRAVCGSGTNASSTVGKEAFSK
jgi:hypothetical protein